MMAVQGEKRWIGRAMAIFVTTSLLAIAINSLTSGWHWNYSISRYVGLEAWSAILFAIGNLAVAWLIGKYLYTVGERWRLPRWFYALVVIMAMALIGLSVCPIGYFDRFVQGKSIPSFVHEICSRMMFACMLVIAMAIQFMGKVSRQTRVCCAMYVVYGVLCAVAYLGHMTWFLQMMLVFESCYIVGFMLLCYEIRGKDNNQERDNSGRVKAGQ